MHVACAEPHGGRMHGQSLGRTAPGCRAGAGCWHGAETGALAPQAAPRVDRAALWAVQNDCKEMALLQNDCKEMGLQAGQNGCMGMALQAE